MIVGDGGEWLRRQLYYLAREGAAPLGWWMHRPLSEIVEWIETRNGIAKREEEERRAIRERMERGRGRRR